MNTYDPLAADPHPADPPASTPAVTFTSDGADLLGVLHLPGGPGPHPTVVLLHGFPGYERNFDLAQALRRAGYASLVFHYRGSWGMDGAYAFGHVLADAALVAAEIRTPAFASEHRLDPRRTAVIGHSLGGFAALMTAAADPEIAAVGSIAMFDFGRVGEECAADPAVRAQYVTGFEPSLRPLRGTTTETLVDEMEAAGAAWRLTGLAPRLAGRPVLLVGAGNDTVAPVSAHYEPLVEAYGAHPVPHLEHHVFPTDHGLSDHRVALTRTVLAFLDRHLRTAG